jgi:hypothetical protein
VGHDERVRKVEEGAEISRVFFWGGREGDRRGNKGK